MDFYWDNAGQCWKSDGKQYKTVADCIKALEQTSCRGGMVGWFYKYNRVFDMR